MVVVILLTQGTATYSRATNHPSAELLFPPTGRDLLTKVTARQGVKPLTMLVPLLLLIDPSINSSTVEFSSFPAPNQVHSPGARLIPDVKVVWGRFTFPSLSFPKAAVRKRSEVRIFDSPTLFTLRSSPAAPSSSPHRCVAFIQLFTQVWTE